MNNSNKILTKRVMVVDDEHLIRTLCEDVLSEEGYIVFTAQDADESIKIFKKEEIGIVLLDIMMPGKTGLEVLPLLKEINPEVKIIVMTAFATLENAVEAMKKGAYDYIQKPASPEELINTVNRASESLGLNLENKRLINDLQKRTVRLEELNKKLLEMDRIKTEFISNVSHELKTPLTVIKGYASLLSQGNNIGVTQREEMLKLIESEADRLTTIVEDLIDFSEMEAGEKKINKQEINLKALSEQVINCFNQKIREKNISLKMEFSEECPSIIADKKLVQKMLFHLIDNAIKYNKDGGEIYINICLEENLTSCFVRIIVSDTGIGIEQKHLPHIFEKFYMADISSKKEVAGIGLGLPIVKWIVNAHDGNIEMDSKIGEGARVTVRLGVA